MARRGPSASVSKPFGAGLRARLAKAGADERGVAALEFALILPLMLLLYIGMSAITEAVSASRAVVTLSRTLADVTSQEAANTSLTDTATKEIFSASSAVLSPFPATGVKMTLSNVEFVADSNATASNGLDAKTRWTVTFSGAATRPCAGNPLLTPVSNGSSPSASTMPLGLYTAGFLIVADVSYTYTPSFGMFNWNWSNGSPGGGWTGSFTMSRTAYMRPRQTDNIRYTSGQTAQICPIASPQQP